MSPRCAYSAALARTRYGREMKTYALIALALAACGGSSKPDTAMKTTETSSSSTTTTTFPYEAAEPEVTFREIEVAGLSKDQVRSVMRSNLDKIKGCYEQRLAQQPALEGSSTVSFTIEPNGVVSDAKASGFDATIDQCISTVVKGLAFPQAAGATSVAYPFAFKGDNNITPPAG